MSISQHPSIHKLGWIMDRVRVRDVCKEEVLAFRLVRNRQDAPLGAIFLLGNRARQWRVYHLQFPTTNRIALTPTLNTFSQHSSLTSDRFASGCDVRWALSFFFFFLEERKEHIWPPPASVRFSFGEWMKSTDAHWPAKWGGQVTITALHK